MNEILKDIEFKNGLGIMSGNCNPVSYNIVSILPNNGMKNTFDWRIAQWATRHPIEKEMDIEDTSDFYNFYNIAKQIKIYKNEHKIILSSFASKEYEKPRIQGEPWIHLLFEQVLDDKDKIKFSNMKELNMEMEFCVTDCENKTSKIDYDENNHAAQAVWYITVENPLSKEISVEGRPDYFWFGIPIFDNRIIKKIHDNYFLDKGTKKLIYCLGVDRVYGKQPKAGEKYKVSINVLPFIKKAFNIAKENDFLDNAEFDNLVIGSTNFGWELPGTFDASIEISNLSINYKNK